MKRWLSGLSLTLVVCAVPSLVLAEGTLTFKTSNIADWPWFTIVIREVGPNRFEVGGSVANRGGDRVYCEIRGTFYRNTGRIAATCTDQRDGASAPIDGRIVKNGVEITFGEHPQTFVPQVGAKADRPPPPPSQSALPNLAGAWTCTQGCYAGKPGMRTAVQQNGNQLTFTNEGGGTAKGMLLDATTAVASGWGNLRATIGDGGRTLKWANGTIWTKN